MLLPIIVLLVLGCDKNISTGEFKELRIGMSKEEVTTALTTMGVSSIQPYLDESIVIHEVKNVDIFHSKTNLTGLCLSDNYGFSIQIAFTHDDEPRLIYTSISARHLAEEINKLKTKSDVLSFIKQLMIKINGLVVTNCILLDKEVLINSSHSGVLNKMQKYDSWFFYIPNSYSNAVLKFSDGFLMKIEYKWRPIELP